MKLPFPYALAAEFTLFQCARKVTLPHLLVGVSFGLGMGITCLMTSHAPQWLSITASVGVGLGVALVTYRLFRLVLPAMQKLVGMGIFPSPDPTRLDAKIRSYIGSGSHGG